MPVPSNQGSGLQSKQPSYWKSESIFYSEQEQTKSETPTDNTFSKILLDN
jgi:hypothetical protein